MKPPSLYRGSSRILVVRASATCTIVAGLDVMAILGSIDVVHLVVMAILGSIDVVRLVIAILWSTDLVVMAILGSIISSRWPS